jgi:hypothetical protein
MYVSPKMDAPLLPGTPRGTTTRLVANVADIPVPPGALVACDLDNTLIHSTYKGAGTRWHAPLRIRLMHPDDATWCQGVAAKATLVYVTARDPLTHPITQAQLKTLGLPACPVLYDAVKGRAVLDLATQGTYTAVVFADDLDSNTRSVNTCLPSALCYRVSATLTAKYDARARRRLNR